MMAPGLPEIAVKYGITSETIISMVLSIFLLTFAFGPLFLAPLSEIYGRTWVSFSDSYTWGSVLTIRPDTTHRESSILGLQSSLRVRTKYRRSTRHAFNLYVVRLLRYCSPKLTRH